MYRNSVNSAAIGTLSPTGVLVFVVAKREERSDVVDLDEDNSKAEDLLFYNQFNST